jgi:hypothetical protein
MAHCLEMLRLAPLQGVQHYAKSRQLFAKVWNNIVTSKSCALSFIDLKEYNCVLTNVAVKFGNRQRAYVYNNRNNPIKKKPTDSGSLFFFLKNWANVFFTRTMRPLLNPVPLKQRLPAAFPTCTSRRSVVPRTRAMEAARQLGSIGAAKAC